MEDYTAEKDRRDYIRIRDQILLDFHPVEPDEFKRRIEAYQKGTESPWLECAHPFLTRGIRGDLRKISERDEALANVLEVLDQKLNLILGLVKAETDADECKAKPHAVDLSATGLGFTAKKPIALRTILEIVIGLLPQRSFFRCFGEVIRCEDDGAGNAATAVKFVWLTEEDQDRLIEHIFQRQVLQLRMRRKQKEEEEED